MHILDVITEYGSVVLNRDALSVPLYRAVMAVPKERRKRKRHLRKIREEFKVELTLRGDVREFKSLVENNRHFKEKWLKVGS